MTTVFRRPPPHLVRALLAGRSQRLLNRMQSRRSSAFEPRSQVPSRLRRRQHDIGQALGVDDPTELAAALEDLATLLTRCALHLKHQLVTRREVQSWQSRKLRALRGAGRRGRPPGAADFAARQFGLGLALVWWEQTGRRPTRTYSPVLGVERGAYRGFVQLIVDALPRQVLRKHNGRWLDIDYLVRASVTDVAEARSSSEEYRRRGVLDEKPWLSAGTPRSGAAPSASN